jgi:drug/metabolite transporter (DMT)-like permease
MGASGGECQVHERSSVYLALDCAKSECQVHDRSSVYLALDRRSLSPDPVPTIAAPASDTGRRALLARLELLGAAILFSTGGAVIKGTSITAWQVAGCRSLIAALALLALLPAARRRWRLSTMLVGIVYAATLLLFVTANKLTTAANAIFLQATGPLYIALLAPWLLKEAVRRRDLLYLLAAAGGVALVVVAGDVPMATAPNPSVGNVLGALSGLTWGLTLMGMRWIGREDSRGTLAAVVAGNLCAGAVCLPMALPLHASAHDWAALLWLGVFQVGLAYVLLTGGVAHVTALDSSFLLLLEPMLNPVWAWLFYGEQPARLALVGGGVILSATIAKTVVETRGQPAARGSGRA